MNKFYWLLILFYCLHLAYLYYAFYTKEKPVKYSCVHSKLLPKITVIRLVYFDLDTLDKNYVFAKETRDYLKGRNDAMEAKLNKIRQDYTAKVNDYNKRGATLSQTEQSQMQEELARLDNYYSQQQQSLGQDFQGEYMQKMLES